MKRSLILVLFALVVVVSAIFTLPGNTSARTLTEQEMWLTFGGLQDPNNLYCDLKTECEGDATNDCGMADDTFEAWCEREVQGVPHFDHDVITQQANMFHCTGFTQGWHCQDYAPDWQCLIRLRCQWNNMTDDCEQMPVPEGYISGSKVEVPDACQDVHGM